MKLLTKIKSKLATMNLPKLSPVLQDELKRKGKLTLLAEGCACFTFCVVIVILMIVLGNM